MGLHTYANADTGLLHKNGRRHSLYAKTNSTANHGLHCIRTERLPGSEKTLDAINRGRCTAPTLRQTFTWLPLNMAISPSSKYRIPTTLHEHTVAPSMRLPTPKTSNNQTAQTVRWGRKYLLHSSGVVCQGKRQPAQT